MAPTSDGTLGPRFSRDTRTLPPHDICYWGTVELSPTRVLEVWNDFQPTVLAPDPGPGGLELFLLSEVWKKPQKILLRSLRYSFQITGGSHS